MISEEITRLQTAKADIKLAIEDRGVEVPSNTKLDGYAELINDISSGGIIGSISEEDYDPATHGVDFDIKNIITEINFPEGFLKIKANYCNSWQSLKRISLPFSINTIEGYAFTRTPILEINWKPGNALVTIGEGTFMNCNQLTSVTIPDNVISISSNAFANCTLLSDVTLSKNLLSIGNASFVGTSNLTEIKIPSSVTTIDTRAFESSALENVIFENGSKLETLGQYAFYCNNLKQITFTGVTPPSIGTQSINVNVINIYVPAESVEAYKTATNWSAFANKIQPIPTT